jgi:hypothetical protein
MEKHTMGMLGNLVKTLQGKGRLSARPSTRDPYLKHWRWDRTADTAEGRFRTQYCAPRGRIKKYHDGSFDLYIYDPPQELWSHPRHMCFMPTQQTGEYRVNFAVPKSSFTFDSCIMEVERILVQAFTRRS